MALKQALYLLHYTASEASQNQLREIEKLPPDLKTSLPYPCCLTLTNLSALSGPLKWILETESFIQFRPS